jgi:hypothetical protein
VRDQSPRVIDQIPQDSERLGHERDSGVPSPQALVHLIEAKRRE